MSDELIELITSSNSLLEPIPTELPPNTPQLSGIRAVVFDIYGTLLVSGSGDIGVADPAKRGEAFAEALEAVGINLTGDADQAVAEFRKVIELHHDRSRAQGIDYPEVDIVAVWEETLARLQEQSAFNALPAKEILPRLALEFEVRVNPVWPMPQLVETLQALSSMGLVMGIISNAQFFTPLLFPALAKKTLNQLGISSELRYYSFEYGLAKPGVDLYKLAQAGLAEKEIATSEVLYVGNDMRNDIWPAAEVGFRTALFAGDERSLRLREDDENYLTRQKPDAIITNLMQIPPMILPPGGVKAKFDGHE